MNISYVNIVKRKSSFTNLPSFALENVSKKKDYIE